MIIFEFFFFNFIWFLNILNFICLYCHICFVRYFCFCILSKNILVKFVQLSKIQLMIKFLFYHADIIIFEKKKRKHAVFVTSNRFCSVFFCFFINVYHSVFSNFINYFLILFFVSYNLFEFFDSMNSHIMFHVFLQIIFDYFIKIIKFWIDIYCQNNFLFFSM